MKAFGFSFLMIAIIGCSSMATMPTSPPAPGVTVLDPLETPVGYAAGPYATLSAVPDVKPDGGYSGTSIQAAIAAASRNRICEH